MRDPPRRNLNWKIGQMDVTTAFLHPQIDRDDILMDLPELDDLGDLSGLGIIPNSTKTVRLRKALYGLKQAPRLWYKGIDSFLRSTAQDAPHQIWNLTRTCQKPSYLSSMSMISFYFTRLRSLSNDIY